jgi:proline iminopeptidase
MGSITQGGILVCFAFALIFCTACQRNFEETSAVSESSGNSRAVQELKIEANGATLYVRVAGNPKSGKVLIANHGGPGMTGHYMVSLEQVAGAEYAVVTYDQRGIGRSSVSSGDYGMSSYVADLEAVRKALAADKVDLLGHSWGGIVALRYATMHPHKVRSIVLVNSGPPTREAVQTAQGNLYQRIAELQREGVIPEDLPTATRELMEAIGPAYYADPNFELPDELLNTFQNLNPDQFETVNQSTHSALGNFDFTAELAVLEHPVLMVIGAEDPFGRSMAETTRAALSSAKVESVVLEDCGHFWQERPDEFFRHVRDFLDRQ